MERMTAEQIAKATNDKNGQANIKAINSLYREQDESDLWPIRGKFNVTERAIKRARKFRQEVTGPLYGLEYCLLLEGIMNEIVNNDKNW